MAVKCFFKNRAFFDAELIACSVQYNSKRVPGVNHLTASRERNFSFLIPPKYGLVFNLRGRHLIF